MEACIDKFWFKQSLQISSPDLFRQRIIAVFEPWINLQDAFELLEMNIFGGKKTNVVKLGCGLF